MIQKQTNPTNKGQKTNFVFEKSNYQFLLISIAVVLLGFILMIGETDIYNFRKIVLAPIVVLAGFGIGFYSILKKNKH
jgi:hypothetical protein